MNAGGRRRGGFLRLALRLALLAAVWLAGVGAWIVWVGERDQAVDTLLLLAAADVAGADPAGWWDVRELSRGDDLVPEGAVRVSPSHVQTFLDCPLRWFLTSRGADTGEAVKAEGL